MPRIAVAALALLAACTHDPARIVDGAPPHSFASAVGPRQLANCTARNARSFSDQYASSVTELVRPDNYRVVVNGTRRNYAPIIVADAAPVPGGAQIAFYMAAELGSIERAAWIERMRRGCVVEAVHVVPVPQREPLPAEPPASPLPRGRTRG